MRYNRYGDDFLVDKIQPDEVSEELVNVGELVADENWQIINDSEHSLQEDYSVPKREVDLEQSEMERRENTNLRLPEWMHNLDTDKKEATDRPLQLPPDNLNPAPSIFLSGEWG